eukprot:scaffold2858_cov659-Pavlova_lutheri.AAC.82
MEAANDVSTSCKSVSRPRSPSSASSTPVHASSPSSSVHAIPHHAPGSPREASSAWPSRVEAFVLRNSLRRGATRPRGFQSKPEMALQGPRQGEFLLSEGWVGVHKDPHPTWGHGGRTCTWRRKTRKSGHGGCHGPR